MTRPIDLSVELPGTPEQVWEAIATGPGISIWFVPTEVEQRAGGKVTMYHGEGMDPETGDVTVWEPPHRFAFETEFQDARMAIELHVEARSGDTCVLRLVQSGFGDGADWERMRDGNEAGWRMCLRVLEMYLTHFAGQPSARIQTLGNGPGPEEKGWEALTEALGIADARPGDRVAVDRPRLTGVVEHADDHNLTLRLEQPAPGVGIVAVGAPADVVYTQLSASLFGSGAEAIAEREKPAWEAWMRERFPAVTTG
jgi:uncharacterized protein YndB with AHSA1/START domain